MMSLSGIIGSIVLILTKGSAVKILYARIKTLSGFLYVKRKFGVEE